MDGDAVIGLGAEGGDGLRGGVLRGQEERAMGCGEAPQFFSKLTGAFLPAEMQTVQHSPALPQVLIFLDQPGMTQMTVLWPHPAWGQSRSPTA